MTDTTLPPRIVQTFMTHRMKDADIAALSTGRDEEFKRIIGAIKRSRKASPGALQHMVMYGSRGFGKSFMTRRVQIEIAKISTKTNPIHYLLFPEEQHNLQRSPHAFLDAITENLTGLGRADDESFEAAMFKWPKPGEEESLWNASAKRLETALDDALPKGKGLVIVVVENFDVLLETLFRQEEDEQRLRAWLDRSKNRLMLFASATGTVDMDYDRPLFKAFEGLRLSPWSGDDCIVYFNRQRQYEGKPDLDGIQEAKARAIADFIGGTPRLAHLLAEVLDTQDALSVVQTMSALADKLAEYYRRRIEDLPALGRGLLDALIRGNEPASQTELAARVGASGQNAIARAMSDLQRADIIRGRPAPDSRETLYSVTDRVFVHYYRLRQGSRLVQTTPLATILDFLKSFYSREEQRQQALAHLDAGRPAEADVFSSLVMDGGDAAHNGNCEAFECRMDSYLTAAPDALRAPLKKCMKWLRDKPTKAIEFCNKNSSDTPVGAALVAAIKAQARYALKDTDGAQDILQSATEAAEIDDTARVITSVELVFFLSNVRRDNKQAAKIGLGLKSIRLPNNPSHLEMLRLSYVIWSLGVADRHEEAISVAEEAADLAKQAGDALEEASARRNMSWSLGIVGRHEEAIQSAKEAIILAKQAGSALEEAMARRNMSYCLLQQERYQEAFKLAEEAAILAKQAGIVREELIARALIPWALGAIGQHQEAIESAEEAAVLAKSLGDLFMLSWAAKYSVISACHVPHPAVLDMCDQWLTDWQICKGESNGIKLPNPLLYLEFIFAAATRAQAFVALDALLAKHGDMLIDEDETILFQSPVGEALTRIATEDGRAKAYEAAAELLPRVSTFIAKVSSECRDNLWLTDIISGFAETCRDAGLMRDIASLLTSELDPKAEESAALLLTIADVLDADEAETVLARTDPDVALLVRKLLELPEPAPVEPKKKSKRRRKKQS